MPPCASVKKMEIARPGEFPVYQTLPGPFATQQGAFVGNDGVGPAMGNTVLLLSTMAKLSTLWAGVNPRISPQNAAPSGVLFAVPGSATVVLVPVSAPWLV